MENTVKGVSVLEGDELFQRRVLSRNPSAGSCSSRLYYRCPEGVPFRWERQPGEPINLPVNGVVPPLPLSPPPAALNLGLPRPPIPREPRRPNRSRIITLWKKSKTTLLGSNKFVRDLNGDFWVSPCNSSSSSLSSSSLSDRSVQSVRYGRHEIFDEPWGCIPWKITRRLMLAHHASKCKNY